MRIIGWAVATALLFTVSAGAKTYTLDPGHTEVRAVWDHAGVSEQSAEWTEVDGTIAFDPENVEATEISVTIRAASISSGFEPLDDDLKSDRFFDVESYPEITFVSREVIKTGAEAARVIGELTIKETTRPFTLDVELVHRGTHPLGQFSEKFAGEWLGIRATGTLLRSDFGVGFGAPITSDLIRLEIASELDPADE